MPKMQVYLPDELYERLKAHGEGINVSALLQAALIRHLDDEERWEAGRAAVADYEAEFGAFTEEEMRAVEAEIQRSVVHPPPKPKHATSE